MRTSEKVSALFSRFVLITDKLSADLLPSKPIFYAIAILIPVILAAVSIGRILETPSPLYWDQSYLRYTFQDPYPIPEQGYPQFWLAGLIQLGGRLSDISLNTVLRIVSALFYLGSAALLGWEVQGKKNLWGFCLWMLLFFTSGFQFLWLSSELLAGAFLMLFFWSLIQKTRYEIEIIFLILFGLTKPDLFFVAILVCLYLTFQNSKVLRQRLIRLNVFLALSALAWVPGIIQNGSSYLQSDGRALNSLGQHYAALIAPLQVAQGLSEPWANYGAYVMPTWGAADSPLSLILLNPARYLDFLFLSMAMSVRRLFQGNLIFYLPCALLAFRAAWDRKTKTLILLFLTNFILIFSLAFYHIRYGARFLPLALLAIFLGMEAMENPSHRRLIWLALLVILVLQSIAFIPAYSQGYWLVD